MFAKQVHGNFPVQGTDVLAPVVEGCVGNAALSEALRDELVKSIVSVEGVFSQVDLGDRDRAEESIFETGGRFLGEEFDNRDAVAYS